MAPVPAAGLGWAIRGVLVEPGEAVVQLSVGVGAEDVELGEAPWGLGDDVGLQAPGVYCRGVRADRSVQLPWIDEGRGPHEVVVDRPAEEALGRVEPRPMATQLRHRAADRPNPAGDEQISRSTRTVEDHVGVDMADQRRLRELVGVELGDLLAEVVVRIVAAHPHLCAVPHHTPYSAGPGLRCHHHELGEARTPALDRGEAESEPVRVAVVRTNDDGGLWPCGARGSSVRLVAVPAFWCRVPSQGNVGDRLTPWLIRRITGKPARWVAPDAPGTKFFVSGSIVALAGPGGVVWGSGVMRADELVHPRVQVAAVRGPLTREAALRTVACPDGYADPGCLVPRFYRPEIGRGSGRGPGVLPHFADKADALGGVPRGWAFIDVQRPVEEVVDRIVSCSLVASSSLHGIILSHAYGVPAVWIGYRDLPSGDGSKFHDYFLSVGVPVPPPYQVGRHGAGLDLARVADFATLPQIQPDVELMLERCPF